MYVPWQSSRMPSRSAVMWKTKLLSTSYSQMLECSGVKVTLRADEEPCVSALLRGDAFTRNMWSSQCSPHTTPPLPFPLHHITSYPHALTQISSTAVCQPLVFGHCTDRCQQTRHYFEQIFAGCNKLNLNFFKIIMN